MHCQFDDIVPLAGFVDVLEARAQVAMREADRRLDLGSEPGAMN